MSDRIPAVPRVVRQPDTGRGVTMKDIARVAGVSQSTVSRVLSGAPPKVRISDETREIVLVVARRSGFQANPLARGLRGARTMLLGVIVGDITDPFFPGIVQAVSKAAREKGYNIVLGHAQGSAREAVALTAILETRACDAIILLGDSSDHRVVRELGDLRVPTVSLAGGPRREAWMPSVSVDNRQGIEAVMDYLVGLGHERIAYVGARAYGDFPARRAAYQDFMRAHGFPVRRGYDLQTANNAGGGASSLLSLLSHRTPPTAVVAATDLIAIGALNAAYKAGVDVPLDISITGFDNLEIVEYAVPPLTTVRMPSAEMAEAAVSAAIALVGVDVGRAEPATLVFQPELVIRESCAAPADHRQAQEPATDP